MNESLYQQSDYRWGLVPWQHGRLVQAEVPLCDHRLHRILRPSDRQGNYVREREREIVQRIVTDIDILMRSTILPASRGTHLHCPRLSSIIIITITIMTITIAQANFFEYMEVVADALVYFSGQSCYDQFTAAAEAVAALAKQGVG
jgi:hypothetical protein